MFEWSDTDLMVRDTVRQFVDKEVRPHLDELESGECEAAESLIRPVLRAGRVDLRRNFRAGTK